MDRREFLAVAGTASAVPLGIRSELARAESPKVPLVDTHGQSFEPWLEISIPNVLANCERIYQSAQRPILAVLKDNGYGHGVVGIADVLETMSQIYGFAVVKIHEALELRTAGIIKPILLLGPASESELEELVLRDIMPAIYQPQGKILQGLAEKLGKKVKVHIYVDTGMSRAGVPHDLADAVIEDIASQPDVIIDGTLTELSEASSDSLQLSRIQELRQRMESKGISLGKVHAASSHAIFSGGAGALDMVRPGLAIFGGYGGKSTLSLKARIMSVKKLKSGDWVQYGRAYVASKPSWIATIPIGHCDGLPSAAVGRCNVMIKGRKYPIIAMVSANHCIIELGDQQTAAPGEEAVFFGQSGSLSLAAESFASQTNTNIYQFLMRMNPMLQRYYLEG